MIFSVMMCTDYEVICLSRFGANNLPHLITRRWRYKVNKLKSCCLYSSLHEALLQ